MKKILTVYTGGTICSAPTGECRELSPKIAKRALLRKFAESSSPYALFATELFEDSDLPEEYMTLSENMTLSRLSGIIEHIKSFDAEKYSGIIVMHGTDTLAFTAAFFAFVFANTKIPIMLVSGNRPPMDEKSNAADNFSAAVSLIAEGISPNIYVPYKNSDGKIYVHLGSNIMQCGDFSEDFFGADVKKTFLLGEAIPPQRRTANENELNLQDVSDKVLIIRPYTGLNYSRISLDGIKAVLHGSYHSGTVCVSAESDFSALSFAKRCDKSGIPLIIAPSRLDENQYSSAFELSENSNSLLLNTTLEAAYAKLILGLSQGLDGASLSTFMLTEINNELITNG